jgi:uncharacterized membrane protein
MYLFVGITQFMKIFNPYFRKHLLETLESHEYLFLNTMLVAFFVLLYFIYNIFSHDKYVHKLTNKIKNLTPTQIVYFIIIALVTVISSLVLIHFDKHYNTPLINGLFTKVIASVLLLIFGIFMFKENYNYKQICGIILTVVGLFLISCK